MGYNSFGFADEVTESLYTNLSTLGAGNKTLNIWTDATSELTKAWLTGGDPSIKNAIKGLNKNTFGPWLEKHLNAKDLDKFDSSDIALLLQVLSSKCWDSGSGSKSPTQMSEIQQFGQLIQSAYQQETSTGNSQSKAQASFVQQTSSAQQPIADAGTAVVGILKSLNFESFL